MSFWHKFDVCMPWPGAINANGPVMKHKGKVKSARRVAWELTGHPIPPDHDIVNTCGNPRCCAPAHLCLRPPKLTVFDVRDIRASPERPADLAARYGVCRETIVRIQRRKLRANVKDIP